MPNFVLDNTLTHKCIQNIRQRLPALDLDAPIDFDQAHEDLQRYFSVYGFTEMHCIRESGYYLGVIEYGGYHLACHAWFPAKPKATVFLAHGLFDHVGLFLDVVDACVAKGLAVVAIDFPGHGLSGGARAEVSDFGEYGEVIGVVLRYLKNDLVHPIYALGQSTGCAALLNYMLVAEGKEIHKLVMLAPLIKPRSYRWVSTGHSLLSPFVNHVKRSFTTNSHREGFCEFLERADPLQPRHISVKWIGAMKKWVKKFDALPESSVETLIIQGTADGTVQWESNIPRIQRKFPNSEVLYVEGAMHHLANEGDEWREGILDDMLTFFLRA